MRLLLKLKRFILRVIDKPFLKKAIDMLEATWNLVFFLLHIHIKNHRHHHGFLADHDK